MKTDITEEDIEKHLEHFGVKGMRWGVRKNEIGTRTVSETTRLGTAKSDDAVRAQKVRTKAKNERSSDVLSNKELEEFLRRADLERRFAQATKTNTQLAAEFIIGTAKELGGAKVKDMGREKLGLKGKKNN